MKSLIRNRNASIAKNNKLNKLNKLKKELKEKYKELNYLENNNYSTSTITDEFRFIENNKTAYNDCKNKILELENEIDFLENK